MLFVEAVSYEGLFPKQRMENQILQAKIILFIILKKNHKTQPSNKLLSKGKKLLKNLLNDTEIYMSIKKINK